MNYKKILATVMVALCLLSQVFYVKAEATAPNSLELGDVKSLPNYVGGTYFQTKTLRSGGYAYCTDINKGTPINTTVFLVGEKDAGYAYILKNGYPNKSFTGNADFDYYITQTAMWWYIDEVDGGHNLSNNFKTTASDPHNLRPHIQNLVNQAISARQRGYQQPSISVSTNDTMLSLSSDKKSYISNPISATGVAIGNYNVTINEAPVGTEIINTSGGKQTTFDVNEQFQVKVPVSSLKNSITANVQISVSSTGTINKAYLYQPNNSALQSVLPTVLYPTTMVVNASLTLNISSSKVSIVKLDAKTDKPLAGANMVLHDASGNVIDKWVSTIEPHVIRDLPNGVYMLKETKAPDGYQLTEAAMSFEITNDNKDIQVGMYNIPTTSVVNIIKVDKETGKTLAGATIVVKDAKGKELYNFVSTEEPYVIKDLKNGKYTVQEIKAPDGYMVDEKEQVFTIDDDHPSHQIIIEDYKAVVVPFTSHKASLVMISVGVVGIISGMGYVRYGKKRTQQ